MPIKRIFKSSLTHVNFITRQGKNLSFIDGRYVTADAQEIMELESEIKRNHPHIYIDPTETEIDTTLQDKIAEAQAEATKRVMQEYGTKQLDAQVAKQIEASKAHSASIVGSGLVGQHDPNAVQAQQPNVAQGASMNAAGLLNVTSSAALSQLASK